MTERMAERDWLRKKPQRTTIIKRNDRLLWIGINGETETRELFTLGISVDGHVNFVMTHINGEVIKSDNRSLINIPIERVEYMLDNDILRIIAVNDKLEEDNNG